MDVVVDVILLNWNGSQETYSAYRSVVSSAVVPDKVIVVDNHSSNDDFNKLVALFSESITFEEKSTKHEQALFSENVVIVRSCFNAGYAGGNNLGIQFAKEINNPDYFWILNNDAKPDSNALNELIITSNEHKDSFISSVTLQSNGLVEAFGGGVYYPILGKAKLLHKNREYTDDLPIGVNYLMGASLLIPKGVIDSVGCMDECFFMYSEEVDWQWRALKKGYKIQVAPRSIVYHSGSSSSTKWKYHFYRNRAAIMFNSIYYGCLFSILSAIFLSLTMIIAEYKSPKSLIWGIKGCFHGICKSRKNKMGPI